MKSVVKASVLWSGAAALAAGWGAPSYAAIVGVDSIVVADRDLQSITVGGVTIDRADLQTGTTDPGDGDFFGTFDPMDPDSVSPSDTFDINVPLGRNANSDPIVVTNFGGGLFQDTNGADPDFFVFEASPSSVDGDLTVQAVFADLSLGNAVALPSGSFGDTGLDVIAPAPVNLGQSIFAISFAVTDLLDGSGAALSADAELLGLQFNSAGADPILVAAAVIPEPVSATVLLTGLGGLALGRRRRETRR